MSKLTSGKREIVWVTSIATQGGVPRRPGVRVPGRGRSTQGGVTVPAPRRGCWGTPLMEMEIVMAHQEACQVYIEQEIKEGLAQGKTPYSIGKDLAAWVEKVFETSIPASSLERRARREKEKLRTNVRTPPTPQNPPQIQEKPPNQQEDKLGKDKAPGPGKAAETGSLPLKRSSEKPHIERIGSPLTYPPLTRGQSLKPPGQG